MKQLFFKPIISDLLKYKVLIYLLKSKSIDEYVKAYKVLIMACGISENNFKLWCTIPNNSAKEIPLTALETIAQYFQIEVNDLKNYQPKQVDFEAIKSIIS